MSTPGLGSSEAPLAVRMRPRTLDEVVGQDALVAPGSPLARLARPDAGAQGAVSVILWGPPGTGKTTLAQAVAGTSGRTFVELSAVTAGVRDVRAVMEKALADRDLYGVTTVLFLDEIHRFSKAQQDALLPGVENGWVVLIAATTENPSFSVIAPLASRSLVLRLEPLGDEELGTLLDRALADPRGLGGRVAVDRQARAMMIRLASGDARRALTVLEAAAQASAAGGQGGGNPAERVAADSAEPGVPPAVGTAPDRGEAAAGSPAGVPVITASLVARTVDRALLRYDKAGDQHYDVTSAFIKSVRGSDVDAALHYLARMIEAGEDPRFIARRLVILASEDIGLADPQALPIAVAAAQAVQLIGMPEGRLPLAQAVIHLASAPKSNAVCRAVDEAIADVRAGRSGQVPAPLRDAHYPGAARLGHGTGYRYPHDDPRGVLRQDYLPQALQDAVYYRPTQHGAEQAVAARLPKIRRVVRGEP